MRGLNFIIRTAKRSAGAARASRYDGPRLRVETEFLCAIRDGTALCAVARAARIGLSDARKAGASGSVRQRHGGRTAPRDRDRDAGQRGIPHTANADPASAALAGF